MNFKDKISEMTTLIEHNLDKLIPLENTYSQTIYKAMRYSAFSGGKRLRPILALATCELLGGDVEQVIPFACAIEMIHTYSLIHDDLPTVDNDDYRRGKLTNHKVFGDAMAIFAGDALLNSACEIMTETCLNNNGDLKFLKAMKEVMSASGTDGMISGQVVDLESEGKDIDKDTLQFMHENKTGALITAPIRVGAIISNATNKELSIVTEFSEKIGMAFQIKDDILDVIGDENKLGKKVGSDKDNNKSTYTSIYGLEKSIQTVKQLSNEAISLLKTFDKSEFLIDLTNYLVNREK